jgi:hypothetical protein
MSKDADETNLARRRLLRQAALLAGTSCLFALAQPGPGAAADEQMTQKDAEYQGTPKNGQFCAKCQLFQPPAACKIVKGKISPQGWCAFFQSKAG